jgi:hypothetical protein
VTDPDLGGRKTPGMAGVSEKAAWVQEMRISRKEEIRSDFGSRGRAPAYQGQSSEFNPSTVKKRKKKKGSLISDEDYVLFGSIGI